MINRYTAERLKELLKSVVEKSEKLLAVESSGIPGASVEDSETAEAIAALRTADRHLTYAVEVVERRKGV